MQTRNLNIPSPSVRSTDSEGSDKSRITSDSSTPIQTPPVSANLARAGRVSNISRYAMTMSSKPNGKFPKESTPLLSKQRNENGPIASV
mmetsp:Transcript_20696/g.28918  ORF Transcript_20696/g.28918 Transcript_20696/m.28918 type:complete len:89 (+) Transcript_20696:297-563(+)